MKRVPLRTGRGDDRAAGFDAFISYSHAVDGRLAPALQEGLHRFAKPWYRLRALRVFRDETSLSATPELWPSIVAALDKSRWFILLASPEAAKSRWVNDEVAHWSETKSTGQILIVLTKDDKEGGFDWQRTTSFPPALRAALDQEPRVVDLRWARDEEDVSLHNARFRDAVADVAAPLHDRPKDELSGEDVRQHRRAIRLARAGVTGLALLALVAATLAVLALLSRNREAAQARLATSRQLAVQSRAALGDGRLDLALLLGAQAYETGRTAEARSVLFEALGASGPLRRFLYDKPTALSAVSSDGRRLALVRTDGRIQIWDLAGRRPLGEPIPVRREPRTIALSSDGRRLAVGVDGYLETYVWEVERRRWDPRLGSPGSPPQFPESPATSISTGEGKLVAWTGGRPGIATVRIWNGRSTESIVPPDHPCEVIINRDSSLLAAIQARSVGDARHVTDVAVWQLTASGVPRGEPIVFRAREELAPLSSGCAPVGSAAFSPADRDVLAIGGWDGTLTLWDARRGRVLGPPLNAERGVVSGVSFSPDGRRLAARDAGGVWVWNLSTRQPLSDPLARSAAAEGVWFASDSRTVASVGSAGTIALSDVDGDRFQLAASLRAGDGVWSASFSPDGTKLAIGKERGGVQLWSVASRRPDGPAMPTRSDFVDVTFAPDGKRVAAVSTIFGGSVVEVLDLARGSRFGTPASVEGGIELVGFEADGTPIGVDTGIDDATVWPGRPRGQPVRLVNTKDAFDVELSRDGQRALLRTASSVGVWNLATGRRSSRRFPVSALATWTADETTVATATHDGTITLWDNKSGARQATLQGAAIPRDLAFSEDGRLLAVLVEQELLRVGPGVRSESALHLWDVPRRSLLGVQRLAEWEASGRVFTFGAGSVLAISSGSNALMLWDLDPDGWTARACRLAGRRLSDDEWERLVGTRRYASAC